VEWAALVVSFVALTVSVGHLGLTWHRDRTRLTVDVVIRYPSSQDGTKIVQSYENTMLTVAVSNRGRYPETVSGVYLRTRGKAGNFVLTSPRHFPVGVPPVEIGPHKSWFAWVELPRIQAQMKETGAAIDRAIVTCQSGRAYGARVPLSMTPPELRPRRWRRVLRRALPANNAL
jgi:hypothetical protein